MHAQYLFLLEKRFGIAVISHPGYPDNAERRNEMPKKPKMAAPVNPNETKDERLRYNVNGGWPVRKYSAKIAMVKASRTDPMESLRILPVFPTWFSSAISLGVGRQHKSSKDLPDLSLSLKIASALLPTSVKP